MSHAKLFLTLLGLFIAGNAYAGSEFSWKELTFLRYKPVAFNVSNQQIDIVSESASSLLYRAISEDEQKKPRVGWSWRVDSSGIKPTPLDVFPGDDRLIGIYIFFSKTPGQHDIIQSEDGNYIAYIWGSSHHVGEVVNSPDKEGRLFIVRSHDERKQAWFDESFDYQKDFEKAFGYKGYPSFIAIGADTDDAKSKTLAAVRNITFSEVP